MELFLCGSPQLSYTLLTVTVNKNSKMGFLIALNIFNTALLYHQILLYHPILLYHQTLLYQRKALLSGLLAGAGGQFLSSPADLVKVQMQMEGRRRLEGKPPRSVLLGQISIISKSTRQMIL